MGRLGKVGLLSKAPRETASSLAPFPGGAAGVTDLQSSKEKGMPRLTLEVFQSRLSCTYDLLDSLAKLSDETLRQVKRTAVPVEILSQYRKLIDTMHTLAKDSEKLSASASKISPENSVMLQ